LGQFVCSGFSFRCVGLTEDKVALRKVPYDVVD